MHRTPEAIRVSYQMDPARRDVYVEGARDRIFLQWVVGQERHPDTRIIEAKFAEMPNEDGGERGRLCALAVRLADCGKNFRCFVDADMDRLLGRRVPALVILTDHRDLEAYVVSPECLEKVLKLGFCCTSITALQLMNNIERVGRTLSALRLHSARENLGLPFQSTDVLRSLSLNHDVVDLDSRRYVQSLLQNAPARSRTAGLEFGVAMTSILAAAGAIAIEFGTTDPRDVIHGKDAFAILEFVLHRARIALAGQAVGHAVWCSFERAHCAKFPTLAALVDHLKGGSALQCAAYDNPQRELPT